MFLDKKTETIKTYLIPEKFIERATLTRSSDYLRPKLFYFLSAALTNQHLP